MVNRIRDAMKQGAKVVDIDGSYLAQKHEKLRLSGMQLAPLGMPPPPPTGWVTVDTSNYQDLAKKIPRMSPGNIHQ